ncbi:MAG TPA: tetratricopeptide repeat protein [Myxococcales bacterium]
MRRLAASLLLLATAAAAQEGARGAIRAFEAAESAGPSRAEAQLELARALRQRGLDFGAFYAYGQIVDAGPAQPGYLEALQAIAAISEASRDEVFGPNLLARVPAAQLAQLPPDARARIDAMLGLFAWRAGRSADAEALLRGVPATNPASPQARYLEGLLQQRTDPERALSTFRGVIAADGASADLKEIAWLAVGRTLYGMHRYAEASAAYGKLPRFSRHWDEALFEGAYADLRDGKPGRALGKLYSLHSPHLRDEFSPESYELAALIYHQRCLYPEVGDALLAFSREYVPMRQQIRKLLAAGPPVEAYWQMLEAGDPRLPSAVLHHLQKNERVGSLSAYEKLLDAEARRVRGDRELSGSALGAELLERIAAQKTLTAQVAGKFVRGRLADMASLIEVLEGDKEITAFETAKGEKEMLEANFDPRDQLAGQKLRRPAMPATGHEYWAFDGEYWPDEIGYYEVTLKDACPQGQAHAAALPEAAREAATDKKRDELIADLQALLPKVPESGRKADLWFQLAELWWEKARYASVQEGRQYDEAYAAWARTQASSRSAGDEPKIDGRRSDGLRKQSLAVYRRILEEYPAYERRDEVLFVLADNLSQSGDKAEAAQRYRALIAGFPSSRFVPDAWVQVGEYAFAANDLAHAREAFARAAAFHAPRLYAFAVYKLAWCDYNAGDYASAISRFREVVSYSESTSTAADRVQLRNEALKDVALAFERADDPAGGAAYLEEKGGAQGVDLVARLASAFFDAGKFDQAIALYRKLEEDAPSHPRAPAWQQKILLACDKLNRREQVVAEMKRLVDVYGPQSAWAKANAKEKGALAEANDLSESALRDLVQDYHQEAIKTKDAGTWRLARDIYRQYLDAFPRAESAVRMRFYYAEILWALEEWDAAAEQYGLVADADPRGAYAQKAAYDAILAWEKSVAISRGKLEKRELADAAKIDERKGKGTIDAPVRMPLQKVTRDVAEEPIPPNEQKLIAACERYLRVAPGSKDEIVVRYRAAFLYYDHRHFVEAAKRFGDIILRSPADEMSRKAANLSLDILNTREEWEALGELSKKFLANPRLCPPGSRFAADVALIGEGAQFKHAMQTYEVKQDFALAAKEFRAFVAEHPKSAHAPRALYNALVIADKADELDVEIAAGEQLVRDYPAADAAIAKLALPALASACERAARYPDAVRWYEQARMRWPKDPRAPDWLFNAAVWRERLGDDAGALQAFRTYLKEYAARADAPRVAFAMGLVLERRKEWRKAAGHWAAFPREWGRGASPAQLLLARYRQGLALRALKAGDAGAFAEVAERYARLQPTERVPEVIDAAAHARFLSTEGAFDDFVRIRFDSARQAQLVALLKAKNARLARLLSGYGEVVAIGSPLWSEAAFERLGEAYRNFNKGLLDAPMPRGLDAEQQELYRTTLESQALPLEDKATEAFARAAGVSAKSGVYSDWVIRAQDFLREYQPDAWGDAHRPAFWEAEPPAPVRPELRIDAEGGRGDDAFDAGFVAAQRGDAKAAELYRRLLERDPSHLAAALNLALLVPPDQAESVLRRALRGRPADPRLLDALAPALRAQKKLDEAEAVVRQVLERHPRDPAAYRNLAAIEADRGRTLLAESALKTARTFDPHDARILHALGLLALRRGDQAEARRYFQEATREDPAFAPAWANLGSLALAYRDYAAAAAACDRAAALDPSRWQTQLARAWALEGLRKFGEARAAYERVLALSPQQDDALYGRAAALKGEGDLAGALAAFEQYAALPRPGRLQDARNQLAALAVRMKSAQAQKAGAAPAQPPGMGPDHETAVH